MTTRLDDVLRGREDNYILPFIWQHGEDEEVIREEMARIFDSGIHAVCVEARPHPDFLGPRWWRDFDIIMDEARSRAMRVWVLDDDHFPTGHAAGRLVGAPAELRRVFLKEHHVDAIGPQDGASFLVRAWLQEGDALVGAVAARRAATSPRLLDEVVDLTSRVRGEVLAWDIPDGYWRIFLLIATPTGGSEGQKDYLNPIDPASVRVLLDAVYEPFFDRYKNDFGATLAGFFSDEPGFYNDRATFDYGSLPGKQGVVLPWSRDLGRRLEQELGPAYLTALPLLWHDGGERTSEVRFAYMNLVSKLYGEHFTDQIGDWCRRHGVEYIGHILEDNGAHAHLGCGPGHFFRALWGQHMAGLDVVLWQLVPGFDEGPFANVATDVDGEFFHYGLAKLGASLGHIDPKKRGRTLCEVFGAYDWREGLKLMKWLTDLMLVQGVNYFVPHAFSQAPFPDPDCPPHLYARGKNPQYRYYHLLNAYTNRLSHLLSGGRHVATVAVLYHAEAEWSGVAMPFQKVTRALLQKQLDCDVLPGDILRDGALVAGGKLRVAEESYDCLVLPYSEALPASLLNRLVELADAGLPLFFLDGRPIRASDRRDAGEALGRLAEHAGVRTVSLTEVASRIRERGFSDVEVEGEQPRLRSYHVAHSTGDVFMFFNFHPFDRVETRARLPVSGRVLVYDAFQNAVSELPAEDRLEGRSFPVRLGPYESLVVVSGQGAEDVPATQRESRPEGAGRERNLAGPWTISIATSEGYPDVRPWGKSDELTNMSRPDALPTFAGTFRYETTFDWPEVEPPETPRAAAKEEIHLDLGAVYETAEVWVNGQAAGVRICPPYRLEISRLARPGQNALTVDVTTTLVHEQRDFFSRFAPLEPSGLLGPVVLRIY